MKRETLISMAERQLREAHENRRLAITYRLEGLAFAADAYAGRAERCLQCAKLFMRDAHTEDRETLHYRRAR